MAGSCEHGIEPLDSTDAGNVNVLTIWITINFWRIC